MESASTLGTFYRESDNLNMITDTEELMLDLSDDIATHILEITADHTLNAREILTIMVLAERLVQSMIFKDDNQGAIEAVQEAYATFDALTQKLSKN